MFALVAKAVQQRQALWGEVRAQWVDLCSAAQPSRYCMSAPLLVSSCFYILCPWTIRAGAAFPLRCQRRRKQMAALSAACMQRASGQFCPLFPHCPYLTSLPTSQGGAGGEGADRNDSLLDPTLDPDTTWGDMYEGLSPLSYLCGPDACSCPGVLVTARKTHVHTCVRACLVSSFHRKRRRVPLLAATLVVWPHVMTIPF